MKKYIVDVYNNVYERNLNHFLFVAEKCFCAQLSVKKDIFVNFSKQDAFIYLYFTIYFSC